MELSRFELIFWDFDGVIKDSICAKKESFSELFQKYGVHVCKKIEKHHIENGGMSRYQKIPLYLKWSKVEPTKSKIDTYCNKFSKIVKNKVVNSSWVPGVKNFISKNFQNYIFIIVSASPQDELKDICKLLNIDKFFFKIYGSPISKSKVINDCCNFYKISPKKCLVIGDSKTDIEAAKNNGIEIIFRRHQLNQNIKLDSNIIEIKNFLNLVK